MAQLEIPDSLTTSLPSSIWGKVLGATPVVMTVIATCLAGLASSEMTRAQYDRSWAAQLQSKASDEWGYFQAKRMRSILQGDSLDLIQELAPIDAGASQGLADALRARIEAAPEAPARSDHVGHMGYLRLPSPRERAQA